MIGIESVSLRSLFSLWRSAQHIRSLVLAIVPISIVDSAYTWLCVSEFGLSGEANPITRWMFQANLSVIWLALNVLVPFICAAILGSYCILLKSEEHLAATAFSVVFSIRVMTDCYHITQYHYKLLAAHPLILIAGVFTFILTRRVILNEGDLGWADLGALLSALRGGFYSTVAFIDRVRLRNFERHPFKSIAQEETSAYGVKGVIRRMKSGKLLLLTLILALSPILVLILLEFAAEYMGIQSIKPRFRQLGIVTEIQGKIFLVGFFLILIMLVALVYAMTSIFDILARRSEQP
jgi:hypothetical protein